MNKAKYVDKMTDLVESTLESKGVSDDFTIADNYDERDEMSMTLSYDRSGHEVTFQLTEWYSQKKEADIKVKDQYNEHFKAQVEAFVDRELTQYRENNQLAEEPWDGADHEDDRDEEDEEDYEDYEDYDDEEEYEDEDSIEEEEQSDEREQAPDVSGGSYSEEVSSAIARTIQRTPLVFMDVNGEGSVKAAKIPPSMQGKTPEELLFRYQSQIKDFYDEGAIVARPNNKDLVVFDKGTYSREEVLDMLPDMMEEGGDPGVAEMENIEQELP